MQRQGFPSLAAISSLLLLTITPACQRKAWAQHSSQKLVSHVSEVQRVQRPQVKRINLEGRLTRPAMPIMITGKVVSYYSFSASILLCPLCLPPCECSLPLQRCHERLHVGGNLGLLACTRVKGLTKYVPLCLGHKHAYELQLPSIHFLGP